MQDCGLHLLGHVQERGDGACFDGDVGVKPSSVLPCACMGVGLVFKVGIEKHSAGVEFKILVFIRAADA